LKVIFVNKEKTNNDDKDAQMIKENDTSSELMIVRGQESNSK
jgi:hypothetical protein